MSDDEIRRLEAALVEMAKQEAITSQALKDLVRQVDNLKDEIHRDIEKGHEVHGDHAVALARLDRDTTNLGHHVRAVSDKVDKSISGVKADLKEHEGSHWKFAALIISAAGVLTGIIGLLFKVGGG